MKSDKASLLPTFEAGTPPVEDIPPTPTVILDGMAVLQMCAPAGATFCLLANQLFN